jgi:hypothetical protein
VAVRTGLEPATHGVTGRYSNQLNYRTKFIKNMPSKPFFKGDANIKFLFIPANSNTEKKQEATIYARIFIFHTINCNCFDAGYQIPCSVYLFADTG